MASACVNNIGAPPENFLNMGWLSPRISFSRDKDKEPNIPDSSNKIPDLESPSPPPDFEFRLHDDPVTMLPADQLFSNGKLVPLHLSRPPPPPSSEPEIFSPEKDKSCRRSVDSLMNDPYLFSPKAPRCSSRWRELLGLKKTPKTNATATSGDTANNLSVSGSSTSRSIRHFLHRNPKMADSSSLNLPLLKDSSSSSSSSARSSLKSDSVSSLSRLSLSSSSSSGHDHDDLLRLSLDEKPRMRPVRANRAKRVQQQQQEQEREMRTASMDSPRMNPSGKIIYQGLERSSSSPSSLNGGPRYKHRVGIERSYSANVVRVTNVPVCSLRGSSMSGVFGFGRNNAGGTVTPATGGKYNHYNHHRRKESS